MAASTPEESFDLTYHFAANLREVPDDPEQFALAVRALDRRLATECDDRARLRLLGRCGGYLRILGALDEAEGRLQEAVALSRRLSDERALLTNRIRLAHVYQWQRRFADADALFHQVIATCAGRPDLAALLAFAQQHYGKSLFDRGRYAAAADAFAHALALRRPTGDTDLIASSQLALATTRSRLAEGGGWGTESGG
jgi:tetratricopeptide (TPR) repeat protein